jgi:hypothetical protein
MLKYRVIVAVLGAVSMVAPAFADTVVTSPSGLSASSGTPAYDKWFANNVQGGASVGITTAYADSGNGSIQFVGSGSSTPGSDKADFEYDFTPGTGFALTSLTTLSYDVERSSSSSASLDADFEPVFRLTISDSNGDYLGSLVYEGAYNNQAPPIDSFATEDILNGNFWATNSKVPNNINSATPAFQTLAQWNASVAGGIFVTGFTTGIGSGWDGSFDGAVDNVTYGINGNTPTDFNFEVAPVPEPSSITLLGVGLLAMGSVWMWRRNEASVL